MSAVAIALTFFLKAARTLPAVGAGESYEVVYQTAAPGCPDAASMRADIGAQIHDRARAAGARIDITINSKPGGFSGLIAMEDHAGNRYQRAVAGRDCPAVAHAVAFLAGLAFDLGAEQADEIAPAPAMIRSPPPPTLTPPELPRRRRFAVAVHATGELRGGLGDGPRPTGLVGLAMESARAGAFAPVVGLAMVGGGGETTGRRGSADLWLLGGRLSVCPLRWSRSSFEVRPCAAAELGAVWAHANNLINPPSVRQPWASADAALNLRWLVAGSPFFAEVEAGVMFPVLRPRYTFQFQPDEPLVAVPAVAGRLSAGAGYRF